MTVVEEKFSKKFDEAATQPKHRGAYDKDDAGDKGMALVQAKIASDACLAIDTRFSGMHPPYWLVLDGI